MAALFSANDRALTCPAKAAWMVPVTLRSSDATCSLWAAPRLPTPVTLVPPSRDRPPSPPIPRPRGSAQGSWDVDRASVTWVAKRAGLCRRARRSASRASAGRIRAREHPSCGTSTSSGSRGLTNPKYALSERLQDRRRVSGTIRASRTDDSPFHIWT